MKRDMWQMRLIALVPVLLGIFLAGWQKAQGWQAPCEACDCKEVFYWSSAAPGGVGVRVDDGSGTGKTKAAINAIPLINGVRFTCQSLPRKNPVADDFYEYTSCFKRCNPGPYTHWEVMCTDGGTLDYSGTGWYCN